MHDELHMRAGVAHGILADISEVVADPCQGEMQAHTAHLTGWGALCRLGSPESSKPKPGSKQTEAEAAGMRERDELLREAEEATDVEDREGFNLGESLLVSIPAENLGPTAGNQSS